MRPIALYIHAKNWEDPWSNFGDKVKNTFFTIKRL